MEVLQGVQIFAQSSTRSRLAEVQKKSLKIHLLEKFLQQNFINWKTKLILTQYLRSVVLQNKMAHFLAVFSGSRWNFAHVCLAGMTLCMRNFNAFG